MVQEEAKRVSQPMAERKQKAPRSSASLVPEFSYPPDLSTLRRSISAEDDEETDDDYFVAPTSCASFDTATAPISASSIASRTVNSSSTEGGGTARGEKKRPKEKKSKKKSSEKSARRKEQKAADAAAQAAQDQLRQQFSSLRLPNMPPLTREAFGNPPPISSPPSSSKKKATRRKSTAARRSSLSGSSPPAGPNKTDPPTIRILVVADIDLASASALAESAVVASSDHHRKRQQQSSSTSSNLFDRVDLCIACGPFCRDDDLQSFLKGRQRRRRVQIPPTPSMPPMRMGRSSFHSAGTSSAGQTSSYAVINSGTGTQSFRRQSRIDNGSTHRRNSALPMPPLQPMKHKRSREETSALEGLMTAAISQLESIVCRVVFVPGHTDPMSTISTIKEQNLSAASASSLEEQQLRHMEEQRLTPNARNIHQGWMPLCPGLGCSGLLYINRKQLQPAGRSSSSDSSDDDDSSTPSETDFDGNDTSHDDSTNDDDDDDDDAQKYVAAKTSMNSLSEHLEAHSTHRRIRGGSNESASADHTMSHVTAATEGTTLASSSVAAGTAASSVVSKDYDAEFCNNLEKLVKLAPPINKVATDAAVPSVAPLCSTSLFQSILVTNFHHSVNDDEDDDTSTASADPHNGSVAPSVYDGTGLNQEEEEDGDDDLSQEESFDPPWPTEHEAFCALPLVQEHVLLEIASGRNSSGRIVQPMELPKGKMRVVLPGSLRERGEFCLVDVAFMKDTSTAAAASRLPRTNGGDYRWRVRRTRFHTLNEYL